MQSGLEVSAIKTEGESVSQDLTAAERSVIYRWLSSIFAREPSLVVLEAYDTADGQALLGGLGEIEPLAPLVDALRARTSGKSSNALNSVVLDLAGEFALLFLGVGGRRSVPPYQSFYVSAQARVMQNSAAQMQSELRGLNARLAEDFRELPDHIAVQLAAMVELTGTTPLQRQVEFIESRLINWIGDFRDRCIAAKPTGFYAIAASAMVGFVSADLSNLKG